MSKGRIESMLEIKNVSKVYKTKGGADTRALDNVSISFGETGMVFLLGKSGSGKSTLLNVSGGLDEPTSGEVIVKGKSSKSFSGGDFDSYRNTFVGFIFQEYNILDEFNVEDNIALALELQGKPKDKNKITQLLKEVELEKFAKRKPNTLSGGQKQRIAIARALVKDPQIIMADEPTGALDSATGKQVLDTLKKLSETRLVIIVSHDREFAEIYGDRIVELKDGKIISDVTKSKVPPKVVDDNISVIGGHTLSIKKGALLTAGNFKAIQEFISKTDGDVIISNSGKDISAFKKAARVSEDGASERFDNTDEGKLEKKQYTANESRFIRSRLPASKALKIGASGLKLKPVRLIFTILLSFISFTLFGLFSTLMVYDGASVMKNSFAESDYAYLNLSKKYMLRNWRGDELQGSYGNDTLMSDKDAERFMQSRPDSFVYYELNGNDIQNIRNADSTGWVSYYNPKADKLAVLKPEHPLRQNLLAGQYPENADEVCISSYLVSVMQNCTVSEVVKDGNQYKVDTSKTVTINSPNDAVGKLIMVSGNPFKITGVFDCGEIPSKYDAVKSGDTGNNWMILSEYDRFLQQSMYYLVLGNDSLVAAAKSSGFIRDPSAYGSFVNYFDYTNNRIETKYGYTSYWLDSEWTYDEEHPEGYYKSVFRSSDYNDCYLVDSNEVRGYENADESLSMYFFGSAAKPASIKDNEVILPLSALSDISQILRGDYLTERIESGEYEGRYDVLYAEANEFFGDIYSDVQIYARGQYWQSDYIDEDDNYVKGGWVSATAAQKAEALKNILALLAKTEKTSIKLSVDDSVEKSFDVVGFYHASGLTYSSGLVFSSNFINNNLNVYKDDWVTETKYKVTDDCVYGGIFVTYDKSEDINAFIDTVGEDTVDENDVYFVLNNVLYDAIVTANDLVKTLSQVFLIVGIVLAAFAALMMFNFISMSISNKRKEIGILRAVGARGLDVFKIFFAEAGIIVGICTVLAVVGTFFACGLINGILAAEMGIGVTLFVFGILSVAIMVGIAVLVAIISTFLPVFFAARKQPVESIRAL